MIRLLPMSENEFHNWREQLIQVYAEEKIRAGNWDPADALQRSIQELDRLLPEGVSTANHYLFSIQDEALAKKVGALWFQAKNHTSSLSAYICYLVIFEEFRRRGYGTQTLLALEEKVKGLRLPKISLHVFGHNHAARALYEKTGYAVTNAYMAKNLV